MRLLTYLITLSNFYGEGLELFDILENYRINDSEKSARIIKSNFPRSSPIPYSNLDRSYLLRRGQERHGYSKGTKICQKGLEVRTKNRELREKKIQKEILIQRAFKRK